MGGIFSKPTAPAPPPPPPPPPTPSSTEADDQAKKRERQRAGRGRASTLLTGARGLEGGGNASLSSRSLLGV